MYACRTGGVFDGGDSCWELTVAVTQRQTEQEEIEVILDKRKEDGFGCGKTTAYRETADVLTALCSAQNMQYSKDSLR